MKKCFMSLSCLRRQASSQVLTVLTWMPPSAGWGVAGMTLLSLFTFLLTACGFHLRGDHQLPENFQQVYIEYNQPYDSFLRKLKDGLTHEQVSIAKTEDAAKYVLSIDQISQSSLLEATSTTGQVNSYRMQYSVTFSVLDAKGKVLLPSQSVQSVESYTLSSNQLLPNFNQQPSLIPFLQQDVVQQILSRLSGQNAQKALA